MTNRLATIWNFRKKSEDRQLDSESAGPLSREAALLEPVPAANDSEVKAEVGSDREVDAGLVKQVLGGDRGAFQILFERYYPRVKNVSYGVLGSQEDAEDVVQEAFLKAYRNLSSFRGQSSFYTWLYRIVFNLSIDYARKKYRQTEVNVSETEMFDASMNSVSAQEIPLSKSATPFGRMEQKEMGEAISKAIEQLSPEHKAVIILREVEGLSYNEISDIIGCSKGTIMSRLHHARKRLQKVLHSFSSSSSPKGEDSNSGSGSLGEEEHRRV